jgi:hypothetical protein
MPRVLVQGGKSHLPFNPFLLLVALLGSLTAACGFPARNPQFYKDEQWVGVSGPAYLDEVNVCENARAQGANATAQTIEDSVVPRVARALERDPSTLKVHRHSSESGLCTAFARLNGGNFNVGAGLRAAVKKALADCSTCESLVVPAVFVWSEAATSEIKDRNGQTVATFENGGRRASGDLFLRVFVFTKSGELAYNGGALVEAVIGVERDSPAAVAKVMREFPRHILAK